MDAADESTCSEVDSFDLHVDDCVAEHLVKLLVIPGWFYLMVDMSLRSLFIPQLTGKACTTHTISLTQYLVLSIYLKNVTKLKVGATEPTLHAQLTLITKCDFPSAWPDLDINQSVLSLSPTGFNINFCLRGIAHFIFRHWHSFLECNPTNPILKPTSDSTSS
ncbi:hypothetical protein V8E55_002324 [Tylopilus felleus]